MSADSTPLVGPPPAEIPLKNAPLVRVVAQVRFPLIVSVDSQDFIAPFQETIRRNYPVLRPEQSRGIMIGPQGVTETRTTNTWRFLDTEDVWRVSLAPDFLALETSKYSSRDDFLARFETVLVALREHLNPQVIDRLGIRYIDRIAGDNLHELHSLVRPEVAGILAGPLAQHTQHAVSENMFTLPEGSGQLMARWGLIPSQATIDPAAIDAIDQASWLLDIDAFIVGSRAFDIDGALSQARELAERIYAFFRWAVTSEFLRRYGGEP